MKIGWIHSALLMPSLKKTSDAIARSLERLSTGQRLSRDDFTGYALGLKLNQQLRGFTAAAKNINVAMGVLSTAESAISAQLELVQRIREIAVQGSSSTLSSSARADLQKSLNTIIEEYKQIVQYTEFNGRHLLNGLTGSLTYQIGPNAGDTLSFTMPNTSLNNVFTHDIGSGLFSDRTTLASEFGPVEIEVADLNSDGVVDQIVSHAGGTIGVRLGLGNGEFTSVTEIQAGEQLHALEIGDINNDGILDLITSDLSPVSTTPTISIFLGNGDGTFTEGTTLDATSLPTSLAVGDLNADGNLDLIVGDETNASVKVLLGNGTGTFTEGATVTMGSTNKVALADMNGDGRLDLVTSDITDNTISIAFGKGDGTFEERVTTATGNLPTFFQIADINSDGIMDIVTANAIDQTLSILLGNGAGSFTAASILAAASDPRNIELADLNGDGLLDIVVADGIDGDISIYFGLGGGEFENRTTVKAGDGVNDIALSDINNDGAIDILATDGGEDTVTKLMGRPHKVSTVSELSVLSLEKATHLLELADRASRDLLRARTDVSAIIGRLDITHSYGLLMSETLSDAIDRAHSLDLALEVAELVKNQILRDAQTAVLAQAHVQLQLALRLLPS